MFSWKLFVTEFENYLLTTVCTRRSFLCISAMCNQPVFSGFFLLCVRLGIAAACSLQSSCLLMPDQQSSEGSCWL